MKHALGCLVRLLRLLLGPSAVADDKQACGTHLDILGVDFQMSQRGFTCRLPEDKVRKWAGGMKLAVQRERLAPGAASKLAGRLSWGGSRLFRRLGRAMLGPIYDQKTRHDGQMAPELRRALLWWLAILLSGLCERREWRKSSRPPVHLFCDARGHPAHLGAVLFVDGRCYFTHYAPPAQLLERFRSRRDNQIMGLELLSISLGFCSFAELLRERNVVVHSDNTGSEVRLHVSCNVVRAATSCVFAGGHPQGQCSFHGPRTISSCPVDTCGHAGAESSYLARSH